MNGESYSGSEYTINCKLGEDISAKWPTAGNISGTSSTFYGWKPSNSSSVFVSKRFEVTEDMIGSQTNGSTTVYTGRWENGTKVILHYMLQNADDDGYTDSEKFYQEAYSSGNFSAKSIYGYKNVKSENKKINGGTKMKATVGMKVTGYSGSCIGVIIDSHYYIGTITKVNKKSIKVNITEVINTQ